MPHPLKSLTKRLTGLLPACVRRSLRRRYYLRVVRRHRESDWEWTPFIKPLIQPGSLVIDIGANVGYLSGLFARWVGPSGRVVSVEPIPATYDALSYSMKKLFPAIVTPVQSCVSDREGEVTMAVPEYADGSLNYYESRLVHRSLGEGGIVEASAPGSVNQFTVPATTLDLLIRNLNPDRNPAFIKIDVEGHELAVIKGGSAYLSKHHPPLLIEVAGNPDDPSSDASVLFAMLAGWGYVPYLVGDGVLAERRPGDVSVDYVFKFEGKT